MFHLILGTLAALAGTGLKITVIISEIGGILGAALVIAALVQLRFRDAFALRPAHRFHYGFVLAAALPLQVAGGAIRGSILDALPAESNVRELLEGALDELVRTDGLGDVALLFAGGVLLAAVCEELLFRGLILHLLATGGWWCGAIVISGILFAAFHLDPVSFLPITLVGAYFGILVWRSRSIYPAILAHAANNLLAFVAAPMFEALEGGPDTRLVIGCAASATFVTMLVFYLFRTRPLRMPPK